MSERMPARDLDQENAALRAQLAAVGKERDDFVRENETLRQRLNGRPTADPSYDDGDTLACWRKNVGFLTDPRFLSAYKRGENSGHAMLGSDGEQRFDIRWAVAVTTWAASHGAKLAGDFVECGVNTGWHSLAICEYVDFNKLDKNFWLFDTYHGMPEDQMSPQERVFELRRLGGPRPAINERLYPECYEIAKQNFAPYPRAKLVRGKVPDTLRSVEIDKVAYLSIDMNLAFPERAAIEYFWPKLTSGAIVVLDDYGWIGMHEQKAAQDEFAASQGCEILTLPTGQGLLVKP
jgi:O-methyltransferase